MADEMEKKSNEEQGRGKGRPRPKFKALIAVIIILLLIILLSGAVFIAFRIGLVDRLLSNMSAGVMSEVAVETPPTYTYEVPEIVVNLSNGNSRRFLSVKFYVGFDESKLEEELERRMPEIRDAVLQILWKISIEDIASPENKEDLREEIKQAINGLMQSGKVKGVYFWHIMIQ
jgi:flagellar FliL protein